MAELAATIAVVIPTTGRRDMRLAFALEALAQQTLPLDRFEVIVVRESGAPGSEWMPAGLCGRFVARPPGAGAAVARNLGWRAAGAPLVAFTDDDCRPAPRWLESLVKAADDGAVVHGRTEPDPDERQLLRGLATSQLIVGPSAWYQTCNIAYPRPLLERLEGFDESFFFGGEDTDLGLRARAMGASVAYEDRAVVWHAVHPRHLGQAASAAWRWDFLPELIRRHPSQRRALYRRAFWKESHGKLLLAVIGALALGRRKPTLALATATPYFALRVSPRGAGSRAIARRTLGLPAHILVDTIEVAATVRAAIRRRVLVA